MTGNKINIFVCYSKRDNLWFQEGDYCFIPWLEKSLKKYNTKFWYDQNLKKYPFIEFEKKIQDEIDKAHLAILLVSQDFLNSAFIREKEILWIEKRVKAGELTILPILVSPVDLDGEEELKWIFDWQILPSQSTPLVKYIEKISDWKQIQVDILTAIRAEVQNIRKQLQNISSQNQSPDTLTHGNEEQKRFNLEASDIRKSGRNKGKEQNAESYFISEIRDKAEQFYKNEKGFWEAIFFNDTVMTYIPAGDFTMGNENETTEPDEKPEHKVYLDGYWIGKYEVTFEQYDRYCVDSNKQEEIKDDWNWGRGKQPVISVSWYEANQYCKWLSRKIKLNFRLPTEAEWEKAARGNSKIKYPWGNQEPIVASLKLLKADGKHSEEWANYYGKIGKTTPVGFYPKGISFYGILDMAGNVAEWCQDRYDEDYYKKSPYKNPSGGKKGANRVIRGGSWHFNSWNIQAYARNSADPSSKNYDIGFRLCMDWK